VASGYLAFSSVTEGGNIWALPVDHSRGKAFGEIQALTQDTSINALPSISTDGMRLVYTSRRSGSRTGLIKELKSGRLRALLPESPERSYVYMAKVSRDGSMVAYRVISRDKGRLFVANTDELTSRLLCEDCGAPGDWFPDGRQLLLYFLPSGRTLIDSIDVNSGKRSLAIQYSRDLIEPHVSPDGRWIALHADISAVQVPIMVVPLHNGMAASEKEWVTITDGSGFDIDANWSPDGNLLYFFSERDGFRCIWGQKLDPTRKTPLGAPFPVYHSHDPRRSLRNVWLAHICMSVSRNKIVFPMGELTGNIWITEYRHQL
jgi:Tol biopolymer transport system component